MYSSNSSAITWLISKMLTNTILQDNLPKFQNSYSYLSLRGSDRRSGILLGTSSKRIIGKGTLNADSYAKGLSHHSLLLITSGDYLDL